MVCKKLEGQPYGFDHRPGRDGRTGKLVKFTTVALDCPAVRWRVAQGPAEKPEDPVVSFDFYGVAQPGSLLVGCDAHTAQRTIFVDTDQEVDFPVIAVHRREFQYHRNCFAIQPCTVSDDRLTPGEIEIILEGKQVLLKLIVIKIRTDELPQLVENGPLFLLGDSRLLSAC